MGPKTVFSAYFYVKTGCNCIQLPNQAGKPYFIHYGGSACLFQLHFMHLKKKDCIVSCQFIQVLNQPVYFKVFDNTPVAKDGTLQSGDELVGIDGQSVKGKTKVEVAKMIQACKV